MFTNNFNPNKLFKKQTSMFYSWYQNRVPKTDRTKESFETNWALRGVEAKL